MGTQRMSTNRRSGVRFGAVALPAVLLIMIVLLTGCVWGPGASGSGEAVIALQISRGDISGAGLSASSTDGDGLIAAFLVPEAELQQGNLTTERIMDELEELVMEWNQFREQLPLGEPRVVPLALPEAPGAQMQLTRTSLAAGSRGAKTFQGVPVGVPYLVVVQFPPPVGEGGRGAVGFSRITPVREGVTQARITVADDWADYDDFLRTEYQRRANYDQTGVGPTVYIPAGWFQRGRFDEFSSEDEPDEDLIDRLNPEDISYVSSFRMSQFPVTREWYAELVEGIPAMADPSDTDIATGPDHPVQNISWYHTLVFANLLSMQEGFEPVYTIGGSTNPVDWSDDPGITLPDNNFSDWMDVIVDHSASGYRLPTEMEWMWAAMGADTAAPGEVNRMGWAKWFAGDARDTTVAPEERALEYAWFWDNAGGGSDLPVPERGTRPVGTTLPNELGLYDMSGNVFTFVEDWFGGMANGTLENYWRADRSFSSQRLVRGGSWNTGYSQMDVGGSRWSAARSASDPVTQLRVWGFRLVRR